MYSFHLLQREPNFLVSPKAIQALERFSRDLKNAVHVVYLFFATPDFELQEPFSVMERQFYEEKKAYSSEADNVSS